MSSLVVFNGVPALWHTFVAMPHTKNRCMSRKWTVVHYNIAVLYSKDLIGIRGGYRFTIYIENWYFRIDICIKLIKSASKIISFLNVKGQKLFI